MVLHRLLTNDVTFRLILFYSILLIARSQMVVTLGSGHVAGTGVHVDLQRYATARPENPTVGSVTYQFTQGNACAREPTVTPGATIATNSMLPHVNVACANARISHVTQQWEYVLQQQQADGLFDWTGSTILVNAGLDDIKTRNNRYTWRQLLNWCELEPFPFVYECHFEEGNRIANLGTIQTDLIALVKRIVEDAPGARIRVLGYGKIYQPPIEETSSSRCESIGMNNPESRFLDEMVESINIALSNAVAVSATSNNVDVEFVDMDNYLTVGNCAGLFAADRHMRGVVLGWFIVPFVSIASYHPTLRGYDAYTQAVLDSL